MPQAVLDNIEDLAFRACVGAEADSNGWNTASDVTSLDCQRLDIQSAVGVEQFTELTYLNLRYNLLTEIDVRQMLSLETLYLDSNQLSSIDVSSNAILTDLSVSRNQLSSLDVGTNFALIGLNADYNFLSNIELGNNSSIINLGLSGNQLSAIDLSSNTGLLYLRLVDNQLTSLDVSNNILLRRLHADDNLLSQIDLSNNWQLVWLHLSGNLLTMIELTSYQTLTELLLDDNLLMTIDLSSNTALQTLSIHNNPLDPATRDMLLALAGHGINIEMEFDGGLPPAILNAITSVYLRNCVAAQASLNSWQTAPEVTSITCKGLGIGVATGIEQFAGLESLDLSETYLSTLDVSPHSALTSLSASDNLLTTIDLSSNPALVNVDLSLNRLTQVVLGSLPLLEELRAKGNQLSGIETSGLGALSLLDAGYNEIGAIDVSANPLLSTLDLGGNQITELDLSSNTLLKFLWLNINALTTVDLSANTLLETIVLNDNQLTSVDVTGHTYLQVLTLPDNLVTTIDVSTNTSLQVLDVQRNPLTPATVAYLEELIENGLTVRYDPVDQTSDRDSDGVLDYIDANPTVADEMISIVGDDYVLTILGSGRVVSLQSPFVNVSGVDAVADSEIALRLYERFEDDFDFIIVGDQWDSGFGWFVGVSNDVSGIGQSLFDASATYGSSGRLKGIVHMASRRAIDGGWSLHEFGHNWANNLSLIPSVSHHWDYSNVGGLLGGWAPGTLENLGGDMYRGLDPRGFTFWQPNGANNSWPYGNLELYLMGLISAEEVGHDILIANEFAWVDESMGTFQASGFTTVTMDQIVAAEGPR